MVKILVVEDEPLTRRGIKSKLPYGELRIESVVEAIDGVDALEKFLAQPFDIVLVDYTMPRMNGLEFVKQARAVRRDTEFIILTCMQDFEIAKEAINLGIGSLLNKSAIDMDTLPQMVLAAARKLRKEEPEGRGPYVELLQRDEFSRELLQGQYGREDRVREQLRQWSLPADPPYMAWIVELDGREKDGKLLSASDCAKIGYGILNIVKELFRETYAASVSEDAGRRWHVLFAGNAPRPAALVEAVKRFLNFDVCVSCSTPFRFLLEWPRFDAEAAERMAVKWYGGQSSVLEGTPLPMHIPAGSLALIREMKHRIQSLDFGAVLAGWDAFAQSFTYGGQLPHPNAVRTCLSELIIFLYHAVEPFAGQSPVIAKAERQVIATLEEAPSFEKALEVVRHELEWLSAHLYRQPDATLRRRLVESIRQYVHANPQDPVMLHDMARMHGWSPSYLSKLFKEESGETFSDYVLRERIELAEQMMSKGRRVSEVAEALGYLNVSSFTRMYKKMKGVPPSSGRRK